MLVRSGSLELQDLPGLRSVNPELMSSTRAIRIQRCAGLSELPKTAHLQGTLELVDLPELNCWPAVMNLGTLTVLGCPKLREPSGGVSVRSAFRQASPRARAAMAEALAAEARSPAFDLEPIGRLVRALQATGVSFREMWSELLREGHSRAELFGAFMSEGIGFEYCLERCAAKADGRGGELEAALACVRASVHPASMALVVKNPIKARWLAELFSDSRDLLNGMKGDGGLRLQGRLAWDLPEGLVVPGKLRIHDVEGPAKWPVRMRLLSGYWVKSPDVQPPPSGESMEKGLRAGKTLGLGGQGCPASEG